MFDKIHKVYDTAESILDKIREFFDEMESLDEKQKDERVDLSEDLYEAVQNIKKYLEILYEYGVTDLEAVKDQLVSEYKGVISKYIDLDIYLEEHIEKVSEDFIYPNAPKGWGDWELKFEPVVLLSMVLDIAQDTLNYKDFQEAKKEGKKYKTWVAFHDKYTRKSHAKLDGKTIPIDDTFVVGDVLMRFPHDYEYAGTGNRALRQIIGCRCHTTYHD